MCHETHFPNPCTLWTQNAFPKILRAAVRPLCLLGPLLSASKEWLLIVPIDSQPCLIYCCMIYGAAALSGAGWQAGSCPVLALATPPEKRRKGDALCIQRGFFCTAAGENRLPARGNPLTPPHSLQQLKWGIFPKEIFEMEMWTRTVENARLHTSPCARKL